MKKITLLMSMIAVCLTAISQSTLCPSSLKRNNGAVCGSAGQLTLNFPSCPANPPQIDSVYVNGVLSHVQFGSPSACSGTQHSVKYCVISGNMPPTGTWKIYFSDLLVNSRFNCTVIDNGLMPVTLTNFNANRNKNNVDIRWTTSFEQNASHFEVESAVSGKAFSTLGVIPTKNSESGASYVFTDKTGRKGTLQYRLKMVDLDGTITYSEIRTVKSIGSMTDFQIFPNPSNGMGKITLPAASEEADVQIMDNSGRILKTIRLNNSNSAEFTDLQKGMYMIRVTDKQTGEKLTKKLTVIN
jgi:hypothetical protein